MLFRSAGETNQPEKLECPGRWVTGADGHREQYHVWSYLGKTWGALPLRFTDEEAARLTRRMVDPGGVMMWDVPIEKSGRFPAVAAAQLARLGKALGEADQKQQLRPHAERFVFTQTRPAVRREDGTVTPAVVEVRLENVAARTELLLTHAADAGVGGQFAVDLVTEWTLPRLAAAPALTDMEAALAGVPPRRVAGAELRFAAAGENLLLFARVADHAVRVDPAQPWTGSVVELFGSGAALESAVEAGPAGASQFFLVPAAGNQPAKVLSSGTPKPVPDAEIAGVAVPGGYTLALRLPFRLFPGWRADAGQCRLEVVVTGTPEQAGAVQRRALFNCPSPWSHAAGLSVGKFIG